MIMIRSLGALILAVSYDRLGFITTLLRVYLNTMLEEYSGIEYASVLGNEMSEAEVSNLLYDP